MIEAFGILVIAVLTFLFTLVARGVEFASINYAEVPFVSISIVLMLLYVCILIASTPRATIR